MQLLRNSMRRSIGLESTKRVLLWLCMGLLSSGVWSQSAKAPGETLPKHGKEGDWYFSAQNHKAFIFSEGDWRQLPLRDCRTIEHCNRHVFIKEGYTYTLADEKGNILSRGSRSLECFYDFIVVGGKQHLDYLLNDQGDTLTPFVNNCRIYADTVDGEPVFCFPAYSPGLERYSCLELRNWGMMNAQGQWVIEPKFDRPFDFQGGQAEVRHMGLPRKIDEQGNFVDE